MAISNAEYTAWLVDSTAIKCILVEAAGRVSTVETAFYFSSLPYIAGTTVYNAVVFDGSISPSSKLSVDGGSSSISIGEVELDNTDGALDDYFNYVWANRDIKILLGDVRLARSDFRTIFNGIIKDIGSSGRGKLNFIMRDKLQRLNTQISDAVLGGTTNNKNEALPLLFGECHNVQPLQTNPATLEYQFNNGACEKQIEVRDNGVPITSNVNLTTGKTVLIASPFGRITGSFQGDKFGGVYNNTVKKIIQRLVTGFGDTASRFTTADLDAAQLSTFDAANTQTIGIYIDSGGTVLSVCNDIAQTLGAQLVMSSDGLLQLIKIDPNVGGTPIDITVDDVIPGTLRYAEKLEVVGAIKLGYCKNWTVQDPLDTRIPPDHKELFAKEWLSVTAKNSTTITNYRITGEPEQIDTYLQTEADANAEATRRLNIYSVPRFVVAFDSTAKLFEAQIGAPVTITNPKINDGITKAGQIVGLTKRIANSITSVEVLI